MLEESGGVDRREIEVVRARRHGFFERAASGGRAECEIVGLREFFRRAFDRAGEQQDGDSLAVRGVGDRAAEFALGGLRIRAAFAGHDEVRALDLAAERDSVEDEFRAGFRLRSAERPKPRSKSAGRAVAGHFLRQQHGLAVPDVEKMAEIVIEFRDHVGRSALLRSVDLRRAERPGERVADVARGRDARFLKPGSAPAMAMRLSM